MDRFLNKITCGDNCDLLGLLPRECIDLVVTSPPYDDLRTYGGHTWDFEKTATELARVLKSGGVIVWVVGDATIKGSETGTSFKQALYFKDQCGLNLHDTMIYKKTGGGARGSNLAYWQNFEYMFVFSKGRPKAINLIVDKVNSKAGARDSGVNGRHKDGSKRYKKIGVVAELSKRENVWVIPAGNNTSDDKTEHPAVFPESLAKDHIISWSNAGDVVLDPFSGSGTTAKMAILTGRQYIGFEFYQEYCNIGEAMSAQEVLAFTTV